MEKSQVAFSRSVSETAAALLFFDFKENFSVAVRNSVTASSEKRKIQVGKKCNLKPRLMKKKKMPREKEKTQKEDLGCDNLVSLNLMEFLINKNVIKKV